MKCFFFAVFLLSVYEGNVDGNNRPSLIDNVQGEIVKTIEGGKNCKEQITDMACPRDDITFWLYTKKRQGKPHQLKPSDEKTIRNAPFVRHQPVKILIHGYTMNKDKAINEVLRPAYFKSYDYNIISVDWSTICPDKCYNQAAQSVPTVGSCVAKFVQGMIRVRNDLGQVHILGHSMGAHVTAWASQDLDLERVTQFDPAFPLFNDGDKHLFVKPKARYADVWHSNGGVKGRDGASGTVDLYMNDEMDQPGCKCDSSCSHLRAVQYYGETVSEKTPIKAFPCNGFDEFKNGECPKPNKDNLADFGEQPTFTAKGSYLAFTNSQSPFIIRGEDYTRDNIFQGFKKSRDEGCPATDIQKFIGGILLN